MPFVEFFARMLSRPSINKIISFAMVGAIGTAVAPSSAGAQTGVAAPQIPAPVTKASTPAPLVKRSGPQWQELSAAQKQILHPLAGTWDTLSAAHKSKWIALAHTYPSRAPDEQQKMQSRMAEWAAVPANIRERARLNFAETKKLSPAERAAEWEAYQGLSAEEKHKLAAKGKNKPTGAAVVVVPVPSNRLTAVPITRHTPFQASGTSPSKPRIDPNTLLPLPPLPTPSAPATAASAPVAAASDPMAQPSAPLPTTISPN